MAIKLTNVSKRYGRDGEVAVLDGLSLEVAAGDSVAIIGPSGCGKSTLLNLIGALDSPDSGTVEVEGRDVATLDEKAAAAFRSETIGFIFQMHHLLPQCSALDNVLVPTLALKLPGEERAARQQAAKDLLDKVGLGDRMNHLPGALSGGERQRVAVARALVNQPRILLADEPTGALDEKTAASVHQLLLDLNRDLGTTLVMVTHARALAETLNRCLSLSEGRLTDA